MVTLLRLYRSSRSDERTIADDQLNHVFDRLTAAAAQPVCDDRREGPIYKIPGQPDMTGRCGRRHQPGQSKFQVSGVEDGP